MMKQKMRWLSMLLTLAALLGVMTLGVLAEEPVVTLDQTTLSLVKGENGYLQLTVKDGKTFLDEPIATTDKNVATASFDPSDNTITVSAKGGGETTLTISGTVDGVRYSVSCVVTVSSPVTSVQISEADQILGVDSSFTFHAVWAPGDATNIDETVWSSSNPAVVTVDVVSGKVTGVAPGRAEISVTIGGVEASVKKMVHVSGVTMEPLKEALLVGKAASITYGIYGEAESLLAEWTSSNPTVAGVSNGTVYAYNPGTTTITLKAGHYSVNCTVEVVEDVASAILVDLPAGKTLDFEDLIKELNDRAKEKIGYDLDYISALSANPDEGVLYFGYASPESPGMGVGNSDCFYKNPSASQMGIKDVTFVPDKSFGGTTLISYVGYGEGVPFAGRIRVTVENSGDVSYGAESGKPVFFSAEDFSAACKIKTGQALRYVTFRLPAKSQGVLYQSYNAAGQYMPAVTTGTKYYVFGSALRLDEVVFVPAEDFVGTVNIPYTGTDSSGNVFSGNVCVTVNAGSGDKDSWVEGAVSYTTTGERVIFAGADFEQACLKANGQKLSYVSFTLPAASEGKLYRDYVSSAKPGIAITANTRNTVTDLSKISFVPTSGFAGTVTIPFTGADVTGKAFSGTVVIRVLTYEVQVDYYTAAIPVTFDPEDFRFSCVGALKKKLASVEFLALPSAYEGRLLVNYKGWGSGTQAEMGVRYYYSGTPGIKQLTFVPSADYQGVVELPYVGYDSDGNSVRGIALIHVSRSYAKVEFSDLAGYANVIPAVEFLKENGVIGGYSDGTFRPTAATSRAAYAAMVCRLFGFKAEVTGDPYPDVKKDSWCAETAAAARKYGVVYGDKKGMFNPTAAVTKQQAVVMLQRAMEAAGKDISAASTSILLNYRDSASVSGYARAAMANMIALGVVEGDYYGYLKPDAPITRAEMAVILYRLLVM